MLPSRLRKDKSTKDVSDYSSANTNLVDAHKTTIVKKLIQCNTEYVTLIPQFDEIITRHIEDIIALGITPKNLQDTITDIASKFNYVTNEHKLDQLLEKLRRSAFVKTRGFNVNIQKIKKAVKQMYKIDDKYTKHKDLKQKLDNLEIIVNFLNQHNFFTKEDPYDEILINIRKRDHADIKDLHAYLDALYSSVDKYRKKK